MAELEEMPSDELTHWMAYSMVEPFDGYRMDLGFALIAAILANVNRDSKTPPFSIQNFVTDWWGEWETKEEANPEDFKNKLLAWAKAAGKPKGN